VKELKIVELAKAGKARLFGNSELVINNIVIDSRETKEASLFVCVVGEVNDGHKFANQSYENGCRAFLMSDINAAEEMLKSHEDAAVLLTQDTVESFKSMAEWYINDLGVKRIGITGSVGKTTTKSLTAAVLSKKYNVVCSQKNYNTQLGLCMTSFLADENTNIIVYEMGMDKSGEIDSYVSWVKPETALITVIGDSHLERLGSKENIAKAKFEITNYMTEENALIFNSDSPFMDMYTLSRMTKCNFAPIPVGSKAEASAKLENIIDKGLAGISFDLVIGHNRASFDLPLLGKHNAINAALAASCGIYYGLSIDEIKDALANVSGTDRRLAFEDIKGLLLLDDSYNANPASMCAAVDVLMGIKAPRHVAILADMYELGIDEISGHRMVGEKVGESGVNLLIAIGQKAEILKSSALSMNPKMLTCTFEKVENSIEDIMKLIGPGDAVLVKGSNATKVSKVAETIRALKN